MRALKITILFLSVVLTINSCTKRNEVKSENKQEVSDESGELDEEEHQVHSILIGHMPTSDGPMLSFHELFLSFQDSLGNDLLKGIELFEPEENFGGFVKDEHTIKYVFYRDTYRDTLPPYIWSGLLWLNKGKPFSKVFPELNGDYDYLYFAPNSGARYEKLIIKCPYIFGDNEVHEIITLWKQAERLGAFCYSIEFEGKEYTEITYIYDGFSTTTNNSSTYVVEIENYRTYCVATLVWDR